MQQQIHCQLTTFWQSTLTFSYLNIVVKPRLNTVVPSPSIVSQFMWKSLYSWIIHEPTSLVALQNHNAISPNQEVSFNGYQIRMKRQFEFYYIFYGNFEIQIGYRTSTQICTFFVNWHTGKRGKTTMFFEEHDLTSSIVWILMCYKPHRWCNG
jgi:hypothetical protein